MIVKAILFDTRSIQKYIFAGNRLKTNIGASYLVEHLFDDLLVKVLKEVCTDADVACVEAPAAVKAFSDCGKAVQLSYAGGGNAMVLLNTGELGEENAVSLARNIVACFSREVLVSRPGLHIGVAVGDLDLENYQASRKALIEEQKRVQRTVFPTANVAYTGLTHLCDIDGQVANAVDTAGMLKGTSGHRYFSQEAMAKARVAEEANAVLCEEFSSVLAGKAYRFPLEFDDLGMETGMNYMAIVHVDGNNMGKKFTELDSLEKYCALSAAVKKKTKKAFAKLLNTIVEEYDSYGEKGAGGQAVLKLEKGVLPIRPLILGGDDVTFICPAKMALAYTSRFMKFMEETDSSISEEAAQSIDCCGGVALLKTSYPFFRGYQLAEQLCDSAKREMRKIGKSSWLDFLLLHGEQAPALEQILETEFRGVQGRLHFGPYRVNNSAGKGKRKNLENLVLCAKRLGAKRGQSKETSSMARSRAKELRRVLQLDAAAVQSFLQQLEHVEKHRLEGIPDWEVFEKNLFNLEASPENRETPYVDAIEMADFLEGFEEVTEG